MFLPPPLPNPNHLPKVTNIVTIYTENTFQPTNPMTDAQISIAPILIVDDEEIVARSYAAVIESAGIEPVITCSDSRKVSDLVAHTEPAVIILDLTMPHISGEKLLEQIHRSCPHIPIIISSGADAVDTAVGCMKAGAFDYILKPATEDRLIGTVRRAMDMRELSLENAKLKEHFLSDELKNPDAFKGILTRSKTVLSIFQYIEAIATSAQPVLVTGETGVGKELVARAIHDSSKRSGKYVPVNVAGVDDTVLSDTLFGHCQGAFTGAATERHGLVEEAAEGTLFLDEIGELSQTLQVKLLRLLQDGEYCPIGSESPKRARCRIIVATNRNLRELMEAGRFREDLYYRLWSHHIELPPLRKRLEDLPPLVDRFLDDAARALGRKKPTPPRELITLLSTYPFPGNIRELRAIVLDAVSRHGSGVMSLDSFRDALQIGNLSHRPHLESNTAEFSKVLEDVHPLPTFRQAEDLLIQEALRRSNGNQTIAAQLLGTTRQTLNRRLKLIEGDE